MPTYDYKCNDCDFTFEKFQSINARRIRKCPKCGGRTERLIGAGSAVIFKGSGFYETDYRSDEYKKQAKADKDNGSSESGGGKATADKSTPSDKAGSEKAKSDSDG